MMILKTHQYSVDNKINMTNIPNPNQFNLNPLHPEIKEGISLITAIKNREETFEEALQTWVGHEEIDEIIIVDWDSGN